MRGCLADIHRNASNLVRKQFVFRETGFLGVDGHNDVLLTRKLVIGYFESGPYGQHARFFKPVQILSDSLVNSRGSWCCFWWHGISLSGWFECSWFSPGSSQRTAWTFLSPANASTAATSRESFERVKWTSLISTLLV